MANSETLRRPNARFKIQTKKVRSVIHTPDSQQRLASILVFLATQRAVVFRVFFAVLTARLPRGTVKDLEFIPQDGYSLLCVHGSIRCCF